MTLTKSNQGYHDRIQRAKSWVARAEASAALDWEDDHGQFVFYWIALRARNKINVPDEGGLAVNVFDGWWPRRQFDDGSG